METIKTHWNSVVSTPNARYCTGDISNMYLCSTLNDAEYFRFPIHLIPPNIIAHYKLQPLIYNGYVYAQIKKAWYGLKQSGKIAYSDLVAHLKTSGYHKAPRTKGLFLHDTQDISFTLVVDYFGIKYTNKNDVNHLITSVRAKYPFKVDWEAKQYICMHLKWEYIKQTVRVSMNGYVKQALKEFKHVIPKQKHYAHPRWNDPTTDKPSNMQKLTTARNYHPRKSNSSNRSPENVSSMPA